MTEMPKIITLELVECRHPKIEDEVYVWLNKKTGKIRGPFSFDPGDYIDEWLDSPDNYGIYKVKD